MARAHIERAGRIVFATHQGLHLIRRYISDLVVVVFFIKQFDKPLGVAIITTPVVGMNRTTPVVTGNLMPGDKFRDQPLGLLRDLPGVTGKAAIHFLLELILGDTLSRTHLASVAATCAPADAVGIEQTHRVSTLREMQSGREAGKAAADDGNITPMVALQRRRFWDTDGRGCVPGGWIGAVPVIEMQERVGIHVRDVGVERSATGGICRLKGSQYFPYQGGTTVNKSAV